MKSKLLTLFVASFICTSCGGETQSVYQHQVDEKTNLSIQYPADWTLYETFPTRKTQWGEIIFAAFASPQESDQDDILEYVSVGKFYPTYTEGINRLDEFVKRFETNTTVNWKYTKLNLEKTRIANQEAYQIHFTWHTAHPRYLPIHQHIWRRGVDGTIESKMYVFKHNDDHYSLTFNSAPQAYKKFLKKPKKL